LRVWVTRTRPGAERTAERLRALGHEPLIEPVLEVRLLDAPLDVEGAGALAFSSPNGVAAFAARTKQRDLPAYAVGATTAAALSDLGFADVRSADGDVNDLIRLISAARPPGTVLHVAGRPLTGDLAGALAAAGLSSRVATLYETTGRPFAAPEADAVLAHSPHGARVLAERTPADRRPPLAVAISAAAAAPLSEAGFREVRIAARPDEASLLARLGARPERG
jgi:uroporphyrinogen-III synthase